MHICFNSVSVLNDYVSANHRYLLTARNVVSLLQFKGQGSVGGSELPQSYNISVRSDHFL